MVSIENFIGEDRPEVESSDVLIIDEASSVHGSIWFDRNECDPYNHFGKYV